MSKESSHLRSGGPPPLPPRTPSAYHNPLEDVDDFEDDMPPPSYDSISAGFGNGGDNQYFTSLAQNDPRSSSTQSLVPSKSEAHGDRRRLLLIYIHGFMGNETSFQSFPAHVHGLVSTLVAETHVVHTKIYPRYRSKKKINFARDDFSRWLTPHETPTTDVILLGHSMGGLLSAEVALVPSNVDSSLRHRLIGTINFDVPFLGMHPRVVKSGLASIFSPAPESSKSPSSSLSPPGLQESEGYFGGGQSANSSRDSSSPFASNQTDPYYNPAFDNDVILPVRKGWRGAWHFVNKHSDDLTAATKQLVKSHLEFGGAMADYSGLKVRYARIRALEEQNVSVRRSVFGGSSEPPRVRFVNYYTSSTGRPHKPKSPAPSAAVVETNPEAVQATSVNGSALEAPEETVSAEPPQIPESIGKEPEGTNATIETNEALVEQTPDGSMDNLEPVPMSEPGGDTLDVSDAESWVDAMEDLNVTHSTNVAEESPTSNNPSLSGTNLDSIDCDPSTVTSVNVSSLSLSTSQSLPPVPELPTRPEEPDFAAFSDKDSKKLAEKEYSRALKAYERAVKDRDKAIRDRKKLEEKRQRQAIKEGKKAEKEVAKNEKNREKEARKAGKENQKALDRRLTDHEKVLTIDQKTAEKEWNEALNQRWNDNDSTIEPHPEQNSAKQSALLSPQTSGPMTTHTPSADEQAKANPLKDRPFCSLPPKDGSGMRDPTWVRVLMKDVDEVGAHCGLFFPDERYERLVGDVGERIYQWVTEAESERVIRELEAEG